MIFLRRFLVLILLLLSLLLLAACGELAADKSSQEPVDLKVELLPFLSFAPYFIAQEEGFFAEEGLNVEFLRLSDATEPLTALLQGDLDVAATQAEAGFLNAVGRGGNVKIVADKGYLAADACPAYALLASRDLVESGELEDVTQLEGRKLAIEPLTAEGYYIEKLLQEGGLDIEDVETEDLPPPTLSDALASGSVDLVHIGEPWITRLVRGGNAVMWKPAKDVVPEFQWAALVYGPNLLEKNPDAGQRFMNAYLKAVQQYNEGKTDRNLEIISKHTELDRDLLEEACWPAIHSDGMVNTQSILDFQTWAVEKDLVDSEVMTEQFWDPRFVEQAD